MGPGSGEWCEFRQLFCTTARHRAAPCPARVVVPAGPGWKVAGRHRVSPVTVSVRRGMCTPLPPLGKVLFETRSHSADGGTLGRVKSGNFMPNSWLNSSRAGRIIRKIDAACQVFADSVGNFSGWVKSLTGLACLPGQCLFCILGGCCVPLSSLTDGSAMRVCCSDAGGGRLNVYR